jgi:TRAP-type C4-dicarboxylate transport system permease small subunit
LILRLERAAVVWSRRLALLGGVLLLAVALATVLDALLRKFFAAPIQGTFEAVELLLACIIFFGLPYTGIVDGHVAVDFLTQRLGARAQYAIIAVNAVVVAALLGLITQQMAVLAVEYAATGRTTINARIPVVPFLVPAAVAGGLAALGFVLQAVGAAVRAVHPDVGPLPAPPRA